MIRHEVECEHLPFIHSGFYTTLGSVKYFAAIKGRGLRRKECSLPVEALRPLRQGLHRLLDLPLF